MTINKKTKIICLMGPTAIGKTNLAMELVQEHRIDIISVDSAMVYKGMSIGTGKPTPEELSRAPHKLIDLCSPNTPYSAAHFVKDALSEIKHSLDNGRQPLLVGGTMLYFKALIEGLSSLPTSIPALRAALTARISTEGLATLYAELKTIDPISADRIKPTDTQRILRALEVFYQTQQPLSSLLLESAPQPVHPYEFICLGLIPEERAWLHQRIAHRFDVMIDAGLIEETRQLIEHPNADLDAAAFRAVGYKQVIQYLQGQDDFDTMKEKAIAATRQLAKRQLTWLRHWPSLMTIKCHTTPSLLTVPELRAAIELS